MKIFKESALLPLPKAAAGMAGRFNGLIVFLLLACLSIDPAAGTFTWLHYRKTAVKKEVQKHIVEGIDRGQLVRLEFSREETQTELRWEHAGEFEYEGRMYDIVETKTVGDTVYYWCWYDHEETMLNRQLRAEADRTVGRKTGIAEEAAPPVSQLKSRYVTLFPAHLSLSISESVHKPLCLFYCFHTQIIIHPPTPPPRPA